MLLSNGYYIANAFIFVAGGGLTIGPDVTIEFASDLCIVVKDGGLLTVNGAILKSRANANVWGGIVLENANETSISDSALVGSTYGVFVKSSGDLTIRNSTFKGKSGAVDLGSSSDQSSVVDLSNISINNAGSYGIYAPSFRGSLTLSNSTFRDVSLYGVYVYSDYSRNSRVVLEGNVISMLASSSSMSVYILNYLSVTMTRNELTCSSQCLTLYNGEETSVDYNVFRGHGALSYYRQVDISGYGASFFSLQGNTFQDWMTSSEALYVSVEQSSEGNGSIVLQDNLFRNITAATIFELQLYSASSPVNVANVFESNLKATDPLCPSTLCISRWPSSCGEGTCSLRGNVFNFTAPEDQYHLAVYRDTGSLSSIDASLTYWGTWP